MLSWNLRFFTKTVDFFYVYAYNINIPFHVGVPLVGLEPYGLDLASPYFYFFERSLHFPNFVNVEISRQLNIT